MRSSSRLPLLTIAILLVLSLQQGTPLTPHRALALRTLNDSSQMQNGSSPIQSNATAAYLPDPSNCESPETAHMGNFFSANPSREQLNHGTDAVEQPPLASNFSRAQNSTHVLCGNQNGNVSDCGNTAGSVEHKSPQGPIPARDMKAYMVNNNGDEHAHLDENAILSEIDSMHVVVKGKDDVLLVEVKADNASDLSSGTKDSAPVMVIHDDDVALVGAEQVKIATTVPLVIKDSVQVLEVDKNDMVFLDAERLGGSTSPPSASSVHTVAENSIAREAVHVLDLDKARNVFWIDEPERLAGTTPPPGDTTIHTAAQSSVARESIQVVDIAEGDVVSISSERLGDAVPPPGDTTIHTAAQSSVARESIQVMDIAEDDVVSISLERLGDATPPPGDTTIHTAAQSSVAKESVQVAEDDAVSISSQRLGHATPPPVDTSIHMAGQRSAARESLQVVLEMSAEDIHNSEHSGASRTQPGELNIHTAPQSSMAKDSNLRACFQHDGVQLFDTLRR